MDYSVVFGIASLVVMVFSSSNAQSISQSPAPAPAPHFVNLTYLLSVAGPFGTFLKNIESTKVVETFQNQANNTEEGITLLVPKDEAFSKQKKPSLANLTDVQLKSLFLYHGLPRYYTLADFTNLTHVETFAGGQLNVSDKSGTVHLNSGWTSTKIISAVLSTHPVAVYEVDKVLLPEDVFGTDIPPTSAPAPSPDISPAPAADVPDSDNGSLTSPASSPPSSSHKIVISFGPLGLVLAMAAASSFFL